MHDLMDGFAVVDLSRGTAGPIATKLLADAGASVTRVVPPRPDELDFAGASLWNAGKQSISVDLASDAGIVRLHELLSSADVLVDAFAPGGLDKLSLGADALVRYEQLVHCSITGYGDSGSLRDRPGDDALVQARTGLMFEQLGHRPGPIFHWVPLPSYGAGLLAACGILAALCARDATGRGQRIKTSLLQGALAWTTMPWNRVERPTDGYYRTYECRDIAPTPCYEAGDGQWIHPMPETVGAVLESLELEPSALPGSLAGSCAERREWQAAVQELFLQRSSKEWLELFWSRDLRCQPVLSVAEALEHPQTTAIGSVASTSAACGTPIRHFARPLKVTPSTLSPVAARRRAGGRPKWPLDGIRVLDFGLAVAGPFGPMLLSDLGADVIRVDNVKAPRATDNQVWAACQRGKRSVMLDLKSPEGRDLVTQLVSTADVIHHNMRPGVAERLGIGWDQARETRPDIIYCHVTGFGSEGPLAAFPGCDQMAQALSGMEHEQGATAAGGHPTWNRLGVCDHTTAILSVVGVLQALLAREQTGQGTLVEANILSAAGFLLSHVAQGRGVDRFPALDADQTGLNPLYRLYETADGWVCISAARAEHWPALCEAVDRPALAEDPRFASRAARAEHASELTQELGSAIRRFGGDELMIEFDQAGIPAELATDSFIETWFDDPDLVARGLVSKYEHPLWGLTEQLGLLWEFDETPARLYGPPVIPGQHSREILEELGLSGAEITRLSEAGVTDLHIE